MPCNPALRIFEPLAFIVPQKSPFSAREDSTHFISDIHNRGLAKAYDFALATVIMKRRIIFVI